MTNQEMENRIQEFQTKKDIFWLIENAGKDKIRFFVPMHPVNNFMGFCCFTCSSDPTYLTECYIDETRYKVNDKYKITLRAVDKRFGCEHYYAEDLESLIKSGYIFVKESDDEHVEMFWYEQPIGGGFVSRSFATALSE